jgi:hypothetical protein
MITRIIKYSQRLGAPPLYFRSASGPLPLNRKVSLVAVRFHQILRPKYGKASKMRPWRLQPPIGDEDKPVTGFSEAADVDTCVSAQG